MSAVILFGIKNCDTIKKAQKWLAENGVEFQFHDYRKDGIDAKWLEAACQELGWESVLNKRGTTYRQLDDDTKAAMNESLAIEKMVEAPAMIKRPILELNGKLYLGFKPDQYQSYFAS